MTEEPNHKGLGLFEAVAIEVGLIIGAGLFTVTSIATGIAGSAVPLSYVVAFAIVIVSLIPTAMLGSVYPTTAGNYRYPSRLWSPQIAFLGAWGMAISMLGGGLPLYALSFGQYVNSLISISPLLVGLATLTFFFVINLVGIEFAAKVQELMFILLVASVFVFIFLGFPNIEMNNLTPFFSKGFSGMMTGAAILYFVCLGANFIVDLGGEVKTAIVNIPKSFMISVPIVLGLYAFTSLVAVGTVGWTNVANGTLSVAANSFLPQSLFVFFVVGGALFAIATTINAVFMIAPKYLFALADDKFFPEFLSEENNRFGTPHWSLLVIFGLSMLTLISPINPEGLGSLMGFGGLFLVMLVMVSAIIFLRKKPEKFEKVPFNIGRRVILALSIAAVILNFILLLLLGIKSLNVFLGWLVVLFVGGIIYYLIRKKYLSNRGINITENLEELE